MLEEEYDYEAIEVLSLALAQLSRLKCLRCFESDEAEFLGRVHQGT
jgi:hypothetical protein